MSMYDVKVRIKKNFKYLLLSSIVGATLGDVLCYLRYFFLSIPEPLIIVVTDSIFLGGLTVLLILLGVLFGTYLGLRKIGKVLVVGPPEALTIGTLSTTLYLVVYFCLSFVFLLQYGLPFDEVIQVLIYNIDKIVGSAVPNGGIGSFLGSFLAVFLLQKFTILSEMERKVLTYVEDHMYRIRVSECAQSLKVPQEEVLKTIDSLTQKGLIKKKRVNPSF